MRGKPKIKRHIDGTKRLHGLGVLRKPSQSVRRALFRRKLSVRHVHYPIFVPLRQVTSNKCNLSQQRLLAQALTLSSVCGHLASSECLLYGHVRTHKKHAPGRNTYGFATHRGRQPAPEVISQVGVGRDFLSRNGWP